MTKNEIKHFIENELAKLNKRIDAKIILNKDYRKEAIEHKALVQKLATLA